MSESKKKRIESRKQLIFADLTKLFEYFKSAKSENFVSVKAKFQRLGILESNYDEVMREILEFNAGVKTEDAISVKDRDTFIELIDAIRGFYFKAEKAQEDAGKVEVTEQTRVSAPSTLPKIQLPQFDGTIENWVEFKTVFDTLVHNDPHISEEQKFHYLKTKLKGEAAATISTFALEKENYQAAYKTLLNRYQSPRRLGNFYLQSILKFKSNQINPQKFLNVHEGAINALKALNLDDLAEFLLFQLSYSNLDTNTQQAFDIKFGDSKPIPTTTDLLNYVRLLAKTDELKKDISPRSSPSGYNPKSHFSELKPEKPQKSSGKLRCSYCHQEHFLAYCPSFKGKPWSVKKEFVRHEKLCENCLGMHSLEDCWSQKKCKICYKKHHSLLHPTSESGSVYPKEDKVSTHLIHQNKAVLLSTATIAINFGTNWENVRALIDPGSEASFINESLAQRLGLERTSSSTIVSGIGGKTSAISRGCVNLHFRSRHLNTNSFSTVALILSKLTDYLPPKTEKFSLREFGPLNFADEDILSNKPIEVILGAEVYALIVQEGMRKSSNNSMLLQNTSLGWILCGTLADKKRELISVHCSTIEKQLSKNIERFWLMEEPIAATSQDDINCETHFQATYRRKPEGRFIVKLPFRESPTKLGESRRAAQRALIHCEQKLSNNSELSKLYHEFLQEYNELNHMEKATEIAPIHYFLPHHAVLRPLSSTTKLRVVFNASKKTSSGKSLNDLLYIGPQLLPNVQDLFLRWRKFRIVFSADIEKMYRQILVADEDQSFQLILWKNQVFRLKTVTYGMACAPYLAIRVLKQLADEENLPLGKEIVYNDIYMDDVLSGADSVREALKKQQQLIELLRRGGFLLRKWTANVPELLDHLPEHLRASSDERDCLHTETHSMLGIKWQRQTDSFIIKSKLENLPSVITKRRVLSDIARLFDPLGYAAPILIKPKIFLQSLWLCKLNWDDPLPENLAQQWRTLHQELASIHITIERWIHCSEQTEAIEIHGFSDASEKAMSAVVYLSVKSSGITKISLLGSKTKVAPLKQISLPRLELTAAVLLTRLFKKLTAALLLPKIDHVYLWTDSTVTLYWIGNQPNKWSTFVGNRVSEIQTSIPQATWRHVSSESNPADCATRGPTNQELKNYDLWWSGPTWLVEEPKSWPKLPDLTVPEQSEERKSKKFLIYHSTRSCNWIEKFSSYQRLLRVTAYCLRFINKSRRKFQEAECLTASEILNAKKAVIKQIQKSEFSEEIKALENNTTIPRNSQLIKLNPFLDEDNLLRVGGRLSNSALGYDKKHPIILSHKQHLSTLIIRDAHSRTLHGGAQITLATIRQEFWILRGRQAVKAVIKNCITCKRFQGSTLYQQMGNLPKNRVQPSRPFLHVGIDYAGPVQLRTTKGRGQKSHKGWISVFVCFFSRALHLEVVSDYTAEGFLAAYRRFTSRRGLPATITTDRGTNFVGAAKLLSQIFDKSLKAENSIFNQFQQDRTEWKFNPPAAPHFGGLWEAGVKSVKHHLKRVIGESKLTFEELSTLLSQIEAILNSRPLQPLNDDPDDLEALTPAHFLIGQPLTALPETHPEVNPLSIASRWRLLQNQRLAFWRRWSFEYIQQLQRRNKWESPNKAVAIGDLVLIQQENTSPCNWPLARIQHLHPGPDGLVRVVTLKTAKKEAIQRPVVKLCPLLQSQQFQPAAEHLAATTHQ